MAGRRRGGTARRGGRSNRNPGGLIAALLVVAVVLVAVAAAAAFITIPLSLVVLVLVVGWPNGVGARVRQRRLFRRVKGLEPTRGRVTFSRARRRRRSRGQQRVSASLHAAHRHSRGAADRHTDDVAAAGGAPHGADRTARDCAADAGDGRDQGSLSPGRRRVLRTQPCGDAVDDRRHHLCLRMDGDGAPIPGVPSMDVVPRRVASLDRSLPCAPRKLCGRVELASITEAGFVAPFR